MTAAKTMMQPRTSRESRVAIREQALETIYAKHGAVTPELILSEAVRTNHPLHVEFEWNDTRAAKKYRLEQARRIFMASKFVAFLNEAGAAPPTVVRGERVRKYVPAFASGGFKARRDVLENPPDRQLWVERRLAILEGWCRSVIDIEELNDLRALIESALSKLRT